MLHLHYICDPTDIPVVRESILTGETHTRTITVDPYLLHVWAEANGVQHATTFGFRPDPDAYADDVRRVGNSLIQDVFPHLSADDREFLLSGITPEEWETASGEDD